MDQYYIIINNCQQGPFTREELKDKPINARTMVWKEGMPQWIPAGRLPELRELLYDTPPMNTAGTPPKTWLLESILATIFCCLPFGIVGIIYAARVESNYYAGRYEEAQHYSRQAKTWAFVSAASALACIVLYIVFFVILGVTGSLLL